MDKLAVTPDYLEKLAKAQDGAAGKEGSAAGAAANLSSSVWISHGVASAPSNISLTQAEAARRAAGEAMKKASSTLAENLRKAKQAYHSTDAELGGNIDKQVVDS
jgi:hypothetical protein